MIDYKDYFLETNKKFKDLIENRRNAGTLDESLVQTFFEENPYTLLNVLSPIESNYNIFGSIVLSQPRLKSFNGDRQPDFLIVTANSLNLYFNFIEIEDPSKKIFAGTKQELSTNFLHSYNQLMQWSSFEDEVIDYSRDLLDSLYKDNFNNTPNKLKHYNYILLYGFSEDVTVLGKRHNHLLQRYFKDPELHHCTYSRLLSNIKHEPRLFTVKKDSETNQFKAIGWVPFTKYSIDEWSDFRNILSKESIIKNSIFLSENQRNNLINQIQEIDRKNKKEIIYLDNSSLGTSVFEDLDI